MELYAYLALVSVVTPQGLSARRFLPLDDFVTDLAYLGQSATYGCVLGCGHDVFECIPSVAKFARIRLDEGSSRHLCSSNSKREYRTLRDRIDRLRLLDPPKSVGDTRTPVARLARDMYCGGLRIFLETAMCGAVVDDPSTLRTIQHYVDEYMEKDDVVSATEWGTIAVWPCMIAGSCVTRRDQQDEICRDLWHTPLWRMNQVLTAEKILKLLWASKDKRLFGPYGLYLVMEQYEVDMPMA